MLCSGVADVQISSSSMSPDHRTQASVLANLMTGGGSLLQSPVQMTLEELLMLSRETGLVERNICVGLARGFLLI